MQNIVFFMHFCLVTEVKYDFLSMYRDNRDIEIHLFSFEFIFVFIVNNKRYYIKISLANNEKGFKCKNGLNIYIFFTL